MARNGSGVGRARRGGIAAAATLLCASAAAPALAQSAPAGTRIDNVATLSFGAGDARATVESNRVTVRVAAIVDAAIVAAADRVVVPAATDSVAVAFRLTNPGNAPERYTFASSVAATIAVDADGDGVHDPTRDVATTATLAPGKTVTVFAVVAAPTAATTDVTLTATAQTGHGAAGTVVAGAGPDGVDAIVGPTGATASATTVLVADPAAPSLVKTQSVAAPDGSARAMSGAVITYTLQAHFPAPLRDARIDDAIPAGTSFVAGSITLDGRAQTDATGDDAAGFDGSAVRVALGDIAGAGTRTIRFQTRIN